MEFVLLLLFASLSIGIYFILCDLLHMPSLASTKAALKLTQKKKVRSYQAIANRLATDLSKHIHLDAYRRRTVIATLKYAEIELSPETYYANMIVKSLARLLLVVPCIFTVPIAIPIIVMWTITGFLDSNNEAKNIVSEKRGKINEELPRFVATIAQELSATRDILAMLEGYRASAGRAFQYELEVTIADMKSGSVEQSLSRLEGRVGSSMLSQVVRGLLGVNRGDDGVVYFSLLAHDFKNFEIQILKKEAQKRPGQMKKYSYLILGCFVASYAYVIINQLYGAAGTMF